MVACPADFLPTASQKLNDSLEEVGKRKLPPPPPPAPPPHLLLLLLLLQLPDDDDDDGDETIWCL